MRMPRFDSASTSTFGILGALLVLSLSFHFIVNVSSSPSAAGLEDEGLQHEARMTLQQLVSSPRASRTLDAGQDASLSGFGLGMREAPARVDADALALLARVGSADGPTYDALKDGIGADADFHLRVRPVASRIAEDGWGPLPLRAAYFGHYTGARAPVDATTSLLTQADAVNVTVTVTNRASAPSVFTVNVAIGDAATGKAVVSQDRHTTLLPPGGSQTVWVRVPAMKSWSPDANAVRVSLTDSYGNAATAPDGTPLPTPWLAVAMPRATPGSEGFVLQATNPYFVAGTPVEFEVSTFDGSGREVDASARLVVLRPDGGEAINQSVILSKTGRSVTISCTACASSGNHTGRLMDDAGRLQAIERVHVSAQSIFTEKRTPDPVATAEIAMMDALVADFEPLRYAQSSGVGDVFGDDVNGPSDLPLVLARYDVVVIGSEASHHALSPAAVKHAVTEWVHAGGTLVVLGTSQEPSRWLQSEYGLSLGRAVGRPAAPDADHPLLTTPEALDFRGYAYLDRAWQIPVGGPFEHVLTLGASSDGGANDALAISRPGAFGNGTIVLASYLPGALTLPQDAAEATRLLHNILLQATGRWAIDVGPEIPSHVPVATATRLLPAAAGPTDRVTIVRVTVHVFRN